MIANNYMQTTLSLADTRDKEILHEKFCPAGSGHLLNSKYNYNKKIFNY